MGLEPTSIKPLILKCSETEGGLQLADVIADADVQAVDANRGEEAGHVAPPLTSRPPPASRAPPPSSSPRGSPSVPQSVRPPPADERRSPRMQGAVRVRIVSEQGPAVGVIVSG
ncbi:hypothetical protein INR49_013842 [Caranx melampygus]|nr:hypothetical protein INR49_013842 [Caranx melampygus]